MRLVTPGVVRDDFRGRNGKVNRHTTQPRQRAQIGSVYATESAQKLQTEQTSPLGVSWKSRGDR